jgi:glycerol kinase
MQLVNVATAAYDPDLLEIFGIPLAALPRIVPSTGPFCVRRGLAPLPDGIPVAAVMADSHSALFAHGARAPGAVKATQGTGSSVMGLLDRDQSHDGTDLDQGVCVTLAWWIDAPVLAFEGNIRACGTTLLWTAELLGVSLEELADLSASVPDAGGVHMVPGFNGLGAPWWDGSAVGLLSGFTLGTSRAQVAHAAFDSVGQQIADVISAVRSSGVVVDRLHVDGGPTRNDALMQYEADIIGVPVSRTDTAELSALGVAHLAGLARGVFTEEGLRELARGGDTFGPTLKENARAAARSAWLSAVQRSRSQ